MVFIPLNSLIDPLQIPEDGVIFAWEISREHPQELKPDQVDSTHHGASGIFVLFSIFSLARV